MLRLLLERNGRASVRDVARALLDEDRSQLEYDRLTTEQVQELQCHEAGPG